MLPRLLSGGLAAVLALIFAFLATNSEANEEKKFAIPLEEEESIYRIKRSSDEDAVDANYDSDIRRRRAIDLDYVNPAPGSGCAMKCNSYDTKFEMTQNALNCSTKFCYTITVATDSLAVASFDLVGLTFNPSSFVYADIGHEVFPFGVLRWTAPINPGQTLTRCLILSGYFSTIKSEMIMHTNQASCAKAIQIPGASVDCPKECILDRNLDASGTCNQCPAKCDNLNPVINAVQTCTYKVLKPAAVDGPACDTTTTRPCSLVCPVDCKLGPLQSVPCEPNCRTPTVTKTYYYSTVVTPYNGGAPCDPKKVPVTTTCSIAPEGFQARCELDCKVDGYPDDPCRANCMAGVAPPFIGTATYPITVQTPGQLRDPCPTITRTCNCKDCSLNVIPTMIGPCDAQCTVYDDSYAIGYKTAFYSVEIPAVAPGVCNSVSLKRCSTKCSCSYTAVSTGGCVFQSTVTATVPWVAYGTAVNEYFGGSEACPKLKQTACSSVIKPIDCKVDRDCPACTCTPTSGVDYQLSTSLTCKLSTVQTSSFGGKSCMPTPPPYLCNTRCPGCVYQQSICDCSYTATLIPNAQLTTYTGFRTCTYPLLSPAQVLAGIAPNVNANQCVVSTSNFINSACASTVTPGMCFFKYHTYGLCTETSTNSNAIPWIATGTQLVTFTESRLNGAPDTCIVSISTRQCTQTLWPEDCKATTVCYNCEPYCGPEESGEKQATVSCTLFTLNPSKNGGAKCNNPPATSSSCTTKCTPTPDDQDFGGSSLFGSVKDVNAFFVGDSTGVSASIGGRTVACKNALFIDFSIANQLRDPSGVCEKSRPVLFVGGDLVMNGNVYAGNAVVGGKCSDGNFVECSINCDTPIDGTCIRKRGVNCESAFQRLLTISNALQYTTTTGKYLLKGNMASISFTNADVEVITIDASFSKGVVYPINQILSSLLKSTATIVFNVLGTQINMLGMPLDFFEPFKSHIIWNFPQATSLQLSGMDLYGSILAPYASLTGSAVIYGQVYVGSMNGDVGTTPSIVNVRYKGYNFGF